MVGWEHLDSVLRKRFGLLRGIVPGRKWCPLTIGKFRDMYLCQKAIARDCDVRTEVQMSISLLARSHIRCHPVAVPLALQIRFFNPRGMKNIRNMLQFLYRLFSQSQNKELLLPQHLKLLCQLSLIQSPFSPVMILPSFHRDLPADNLYQAWTCNGRLRRWDSRTSRKRVLHQ